MTPHSSSFFKCGRWDLNPHERNAHKILSLAFHKNSILTFINNSFVVSFKKTAQDFFLI